MIPIASDDSFRVYRFSYGSFDIFIPLFFFRARVDARSQIIASPSTRRFDLISWKPRELPGNSSFLFLQRYTSPLVNDEEPQCSSNMAITVIPRERMLDTPFFFLRHELCVRGLGLTRCYAATWKRFRRYFQRKCEALPHGDRHCVDARDAQVGTTTIIFYYSSDWSIRFLFDENQFCAFYALIRGDPN